MRRIVAVVAIAGVVALFGPVVSGEPAADKKTNSAPAPKAKHHETRTGQMDCSLCHTCKTPTKDKPCLRPCSRPALVPTTQTADEQLPDDYVLLHAFEWEKRRFLPSWFNHKAHAGMAAMGAKGCTTCHHHSDQNKPHPPCKTCHKSEFVASGDIRMPGLKAAYHRQCMGCHRDWSHATQCSRCHRPKGDVSTEFTPPKPDPADIIHHPPIKNPELKVYQTDCDEGAVVSFHHKYHIDRYDLKCEHCHHSENCLSCHDETAKPEELGAATKAEHDACEECHDLDNCRMCHHDKPQPKPLPFDHGKRTGYALSKQHVKVTCRACHNSVPFGKLSRDCAACHKGWGPDTFDHAITGQILDENHADSDCTDCHTGGKYDRPPSCQECHEEDVTFPAQRPGPAAKASEGAGKK